MASADKAYVRISIHTQVEPIPTKVYRKEISRTVDVESTKYFPIEAAVLIGIPTSVKRELGGKVPVDGVPIESNASVSASHEMSWTNISNESWTKKDQYHELITEFPENQKGIFAIKTTQIQIGAHVANGVRFKNQ